MARADAAERLDTVLRQSRPRDARVVLALKVLDEPRFLEPLEQPRDAGRRQHQTLDQVDAAQPQLIGTREVHQRLEVVHRQPSRPQDLGVELTAQHAVSPHQTGEGSELNWLWREYLTAQCLSSIVADTSKCTCRTKGEQ
jgi:hypothetical protein